MFGNIKNMQIIETILLSSFAFLRLFANYGPALFLSLLYYFLIVCIISHVPYNLLIHYG